jgi:hypothetical protein
VKTSKHGRTTCQQTKKPIYDRKGLHSDQRRCYGGDSEARSSRATCPHPTPSTARSQPGNVKKKAIPTRVYHPESTEIPRLQMVQPARSSAKATRKTLKGEPRNSLVKKWWVWGLSFPHSSRATRATRTKGGAKRQGIQIRERAYGRERP